MFGTNMAPSPPSFRQLGFNHRLNWRAECPTALQWGPLLQEVSFTSTFPTPSHLLYAADEFSLVSGLSRALPAFTTFPTTFHPFYTEEVRNGAERDPVPPRPSPIRTLNLYMTRGATTGTSRAVSKSRPDSGATAGPTIQLVQSLEWERKPSPHCRRRQS